MAVAELKKGSVADKSGPADVPTLQQKEQRLRMVVAEKDIELLDLRRHLFSARQAASPHIAQASRPHHRHTTWLLLAGLAQGQHRPPRSQARVPARCSCYELLSGHEQVRQLLLDPGSHASSSD